MHRRVLCILAAASGLTLPRIGDARVSATASPPVVTWSGPVLGGIGSIALAHPDARVAQQLVTRCVSEVQRLENLFSLWRSDSQLSELNRRGVLVAPSRDTVQLLTQAQQVATLTEGLFDVTVQPLWALYRDHFTAAEAEPHGPSPEALQAALARVNQRDLLVSSNRIAFGRQRMAVTLNGIAQGYVTDRIVALLRGAGVVQTLVNLGESRAVGAHPAGRPWRASLEDPEAPGRMWGEVELADRALATSGDAGFVFDAAGRFTHLLHPRTGRSPRRYRAVSVLAPEATFADALSTAFALMPEADISATLRELPGVEVWLLHHDGRSTSLRSAG